jgi:hypothetical protein
MAGERDILRNLTFSIDGHPISTGASKFEVKMGRERLPWQSYEEAGQFSEKGDWTASVALEGYGVEAEGKLLELLGDDDEDSSSFLLFLESNTRNSPHSNPGDAALFMTARTFGVDMEAEGGKIKRFSSQHENSDGTRPLVGQVIYTNRAKTPAPLGAGVVTPTPPITVPALAAGFEAVFPFHVTKISGTGTVTVLAELLSDTPGFASPVVRHTYAIVTNDVTPPPGELLGPISQTVVLDGDVAAFPGETQWTIRFTVTDSDTDAQVEIMAAGTVVAKF